MPVIVIVAGATTMGVWGGVDSGRLPLVPAPDDASCVLPEVDDNRLRGPSIGWPKVKDGGATNDEAELEQSGLAGRGAGGGEKDEPLGFCGGTGMKRAWVEVGVGTGVDCLDEDVEGRVARCGVATADVVWRLNTSPNSPGANATVEQNPSEELIASVRPSIDLKMAMSIATRNEHHQLTRSNQ